MNNLEENNINLYFENPIINNLKNLKLKIKNNINYKNKSYLNYYHEIKTDDLIISFNGLYKDEYFIILIDYINIKLNTSVYDKNIIIIKLDWKLTKINENLVLWEINILDNKKYKYFYLPLRKFLENNNDISITDMLAIHRCINYNLRIKKNNSTFLSFFN